MSAELFESSGGHYDAAGHQMYEDEEDTDVVHALARALGDNDDKDPFGNRKGGKRHRIPDLELGLKTSFTTKQWRERERKMHEEALITIQSPLAVDIDKHQASVERSLMLMSYGRNNKEKSQATEQAQMRLENNLLAERLLKVQRAITEITETNLPNRNHALKAISDRKRFLRAARYNTQVHLDYENSLLLRRLTEAKSSLSRRTMQEDFRRHKAIQHNMCRLAHPPKHKLAEEAPVGNVRRGIKPRQGLRAAGSASLGNKSRPQGLNLVSVSGNVQGQSKASSLETHLLQEFDNLGLYNSEIAATLLQDRGQVFQYICDVPFLNEDGQVESHIKALVLGFKKKAKKGVPAMMVVEASTDAVKRYVEISHDTLRKKLEEQVDNTTDNANVKLGNIVAVMIQFVGAGFELQCKPE